MTFLGALIQVTRDLLAVSLLAAGAAKIADVRGFASTLDTLGIPLGLTRAAAGMVAGTEIGVGLMALVGLWPQLTDVVVLLLTACFVVVNSYAAARKPSMRCQCFGALADSRFGRISVVRALALSAMALTVVLLGAHSDVERPALPWPILSALAAILLIVAVVQAATAIEIVRQERGLP